MNLDSDSIPPRLNPGRVLDKDTPTMPLSAPDRTTPLLHNNMQQNPSNQSRELDRQARLVPDSDATTSMRVDRSSGNPPGRDLATLEQRGGDSNPSSSLPSGTMTSHDMRAGQSSQRRSGFPSSSNSQDTSSTNETDPVFTPPASDGRRSPNKGPLGDSSQESQLLQLSQIAAAQERIPDNGRDMGDSGAASRKRMADGMVKHTRDKSGASPVRIGGHSRNTSTVSMASTTSSRIGEISATLKERLSYAMVKVNNGWQSHSIDQVEALASQGGSPTSTHSNSTIHLRNGSSASPQLSNASHRGSNITTPATAPQHQFPSRLNEAGWKRSPHSGSAGSPTSPVMGLHTLAPPVSIQPSRQIHNPRRNSVPRHTPTLLSGAHHPSPNPGPHTPGQASPYLGNSHHRTPMADPILFSPHQNVREQDAIETLLFMSSPGNSANLKHNFTGSSSQPVPSSLSTQRTALPSSQPCKSLPSGRPSHARSQSHSQKRVGFEKSPNDMDIDDPYGSPYSRATPRRKLNGGAVGHGSADGNAAVPRLKQLPVSMGLTVPSRPRKVLGEEEIDRMLDRVAADDGSDSEGEIQIPVSRARRDGAAQVVGA
ncbi:cell cycle transcriptional repressor whi5 [Naviculisporaceae sp. PSN 640]